MRFLRSLLCRRRRIDDRFARRIAIHLADASIGSGFRGMRHGWPLSRALANIGRIVDRMSDGQVPKREAPNGARSGYRIG
jgi:hypothetical protein